MKKLIYHNSWDNLSMAEKAEMIGVAVRNGITSLPEIRAKYNEFAEGGDTVGEWVDAIYQNNPKEEFLGEPEHHYDFTQSEEWANAHGYYPDARGHRDDRVKKPAHPSHPSRGTWNGDKFILTDTGMENPNYTLFGLNDGGQDPQAILTYQGGSVIPEITVTPNGNYIYNPYDNIKLHYSEGGNLYGGGSYLDKAKAMIRANEGWRSKPYKDAPKGKNWRSVGYGFNDSGFWERYPEGISKHYENGITKAQAEKELDYFLGKAERQLKGIYGKRWNSFNDDQKAAILDTYYQRPASVGSKSGFYGAVMSGKDGAPYLGVQGFGDRNQSRRDLYRGRGVTAPVSFESIAEPVVSEADEVLHFEPLNPQAFGMQLPTYQAPVIDTIDTTDKVATIDKTYDPVAIEKQERQDNLRRFGMFMSMLDGGSGQDSGMPDFINMLAGKPITYRKGGHLYDGTSEDSQQMQQGYIRQRPEGSYFYDVQGQPTIDVIPLNTSLSDNPADWTFTDASGKIYNPHREAVKGTGELLEAVKEGPLVSAANNYFRELNWRIQNDPSSIALKGKYTMPLVFSPLLGQGAATALTNPYVDAALTSGFAAHGLNHWLNEGINGWGDAAMTALEVAPLGRLAKPIWDAGKEGLQYTTKAVDNATRYVSPSYDLYKTVGETPIINRSFPTKSLYRADVYRGGKIRDPHNISLTTDQKYAEQYGEVTPYLFESNSIAKAKEPLMGYRDPVNNDMFIYRNTKDAPGANAIVGHDLVTGEFPYNSKGTEIISLSPDNIYPKPLETPTIEWTEAVKSPQITAENAAIITPEQWTAAQDAAIARGDMAEAQRLRDLHFKVSAPETKIIDEKGNPLHLYHGTKNRFNAFDESLYGSTDGGMYGTGVYTTPYRDYAENYGNNIMDLYANIINPVDARNLSIDDLMLGKLEEGNNIFRWTDIGGKKDGVLGKNHYLNTKYPYEVVSHKPSKVKSADAVTYNDKGVRIPLGSRDNFNLNYIRYGLLPIGIGLTGYSLNQKR